MLAIGRTSSRVFGESEWFSELLGETFEYNICRWKQNLKNGGELRWVQGFNSESADTQKRIESWQLKWGLSTR